MGLKASYQPSIDVTLAAGIPKVSYGLPYDIKSISVPQSENYWEFEGEESSIISVIGPAPEEVAEEIIAPLTTIPQLKGKIHWWGGPGIAGTTVHEKIDYRKAHSRTFISPILLSPKEADIGYYTPKILEIMIFGGLPVGFVSSKAMEKVLPEDCLIEDYTDIIAILTCLDYYKTGYRNSLRRQIVEKLSQYYSAEGFVDSILKKLKEI